MKQSALAKPRPHPLNRGVDFDRMIGATARRPNLTLITNNCRPFQRSAGRNLISV